MSKDKDNKDNQQNKGLVSWIYSWITSRINDAMEVVKNLLKNTFPAVPSKKPEKNWVDKANKDIDDINRKAKMLRETSKLQSIINKADLTKAQEKSEKVKSVTPKIADEHPKQDSTIVERVSAFFNDVLHGYKKVKAHLEVASKSTEKVGKALGEAKNLTSQLNTLNKAAQATLENKALDPETQKELAAITSELEKQGRNESRAKLRHAIKNSQQSIDANKKAATQRANPSKNGRSH